MKRITLLPFFILAVSVLSYSQTVDKTNNEYPDVSGYAGTWISIEEGDTLIVNLEIGTYFYEPLKKDIPQLFGTYNYSPLSNTHLKMLTVDEGEFTLQGGFLNEHGPRTYLMFAFKDTEIHKAGALRLYVDELNKNVLHWHLEKRERWSINGETRIPEGYSVPMELTLVRVDSD